MSSNTPNLGLLKKDPMVDGNETFNIETMLNENWDKVDEAVGRTGGYGVTTQPKANEYEVNLKPAPASLTAGIRVTVKVNVASTGAPMLNVNGLGSKPVLKTNGSSASFKQDGLYTLVYDGQAFILQGEGGDYGTAGAAQVLSGYSIGTENGLVNGNIPDYSRSKLGQGYAQAVSAKGDHGGALVVEPAKGYYEPGVNSGGFGSIITTDPNYKPDNIRAGTSIFGVPGKSTVVDTADGNLAAGSMLTGQVGYSKGQKVTGTMVNRNTDQPATNVIAQSDRLYVRPPAGYYNGSTHVYSPEPNLKAENIKAGRTIGSVNGSLIPVKRIFRGSTSITNGEAHKTLNMPTGWDPYKTALRFSYQFPNGTYEYIRSTAVKGIIYPSANTFSFSRHQGSSNSGCDIRYELIEYESQLMNTWIDVSSSPGPNFYYHTLPYTVVPQRTLIFGSYTLASSDGGPTGMAMAPMVFLGGDGTTATREVHYRGDARQGFPVGTTQNFSIQIIEF